MGRVEDGGGDLVLVPVLVLVLVQDVHMGYWLFLTFLLLQGKIWDYPCVECVLLKKEGDSHDEMFTLL